MARYFRQITGGLPVPPNQVTMILSFNHSEGGDPMSNEIRACGSDFGCVVISTRQPSAR